MTRDHWKAMLPFVEAFARGEDVEWFSSASNKWIAKDTAYFFDSPSLYRIATKPHYRPWKPEEVPVGSVVVAKSNPTHIWLIIGVSGFDIRVGTRLYTCQEVFNYFTLTAGSPCGTPCEEVAS